MSFRCCVKHKVIHPRNLASEIASCKFELIINIAKFIIKGHRFVIWSWFGSVSQHGESWLLTGGTSTAINATTGSSRTLRTRETLWTLCTHETLLTSFSWRASGTRLSFEFLQGDTVQLILQCWENIILFKNYNSSSNTAIRLFINAIFNWSFSTTHGHGMYITHYFLTWCSFFSHCSW